MCYVVVAAAVVVAVASAAVSLVVVVVAVAALWAQRMLLAFSFTCTASAHYVFEHTDTHTRTRIHTRMRAEHCVLRVNTKRYFTDFLCAAFRNCMYDGTEGQSEHSGTDRGINLRNPQIFLCLLACLYP